MADCPDPGMSGRDWERVRVTTERLENRARGRMTTMKRPLSPQMAEYHDLEPAMDYWLTYVEHKLTAAELEQIKNCIRDAYDNARGQGYAAGVQMVKNTVADIRVPFDMRAST